MTIETPIEILEKLSLSSNITVSELAKEMNKSKSATWRVIRNLKKSGYLKRVGSTKTGYWQIILRQRFLDVGGLVYFHLCLSCFFDSLTDV